MLLVDYRNCPDYAKKAKATDLLTPLLDAGLPAEQTTLQFGDVAWMGRGVGGADIFCGLEFKKLPDLVQSLVSDRLAGHQLPGLVQTYDRSYLMVEGAWSVDSRGRVITKHRFGSNRWVPLKGCPAASVLMQRVLTLMTRGGLTVLWTDSQQESVRWIAALYRFWTDKQLDDHRSHLALYAPDMDPALKEVVSDFRYGLNGFVPGLGLARTAAIEQACGGRLDTLKAMAVDQIADITVNGRRLGPAKAAHILEKLK